MVTKKQILKAQEAAIDAEVSLNAALGHLAALASEVLGREVVADLCGGDEIEFRSVNNSGVADAFDTILIEDILRLL